MASVLEGAKLTEDACNLLASIDSLAGDSGLDVNAPITAFILDSEAVAWDIGAAQILPFQALSKRKRKVSRLTVYGNFWQPPMTNSQIPSDIFKAHV